MIRSDQLFRDKENSMDNYIFLTHEGYTFQPDSESDVPDIENLQVIGICNGENEKEAFYNLMGLRRYLISTTFDKIFCYKLSSNYKDSYLEFSIKDDYDIENEKYSIDKLSNRNFFNEVNTLLNGKDLISNFIYIIINKSYKYTTN